MSSPKSALIVVDIQRDFCPGGSIPVEESDEIVGPTNSLISEFERQGLPIFLTRDWHPADHRSFRSRGGIWPSHCVKNSSGAEFHPSLRIPRGLKIVDKATESNTEAYSAFQGTDLAAMLRRNGTKKLYLAGLATDYCVKETVMDGLSNGFAIDVVTDAVKGVDPEDSMSALRDMSAKGAVMTDSKAVLKEMRRRVAISSSS
jgi:nicotinamidase/pyrazinamidase